jgi:hypothetical protein
VSLPTNLANLAQIGLTIGTATVPAIRIANALAALSGNGIGIARRSVSGIRCAKIRVIVTPWIGAIHAKTVVLRVR